MGFGHRVPGAGVWVRVLEGALAQANIGGTPVAGASTGSGRPEGVHPEAGTTATTSVGRGVGQRRGRKEKATAASGGVLR